MNDITKSTCTLDGSDGLGTHLGCSTIICIPEFDFGNTAIQNLIESYLLKKAIVFINSSLNIVKTV